MNENILNKKCFIEEQSSKRVYSSVTGELLCNDSYNLEKHAKKMHFRASDFGDKPLKEKKDFVFAFKGYSDRLVLYVYTPILIRAHGHKKYAKGEWMKVYQCNFYKDGRLEEEGLNTIDYWKAYPHMRLLNKESLYQIMYDNLHIPGVASLRMFVDIFKGKGFHYEELLSPEQAKWELSQMETHEPEWYTPVFTRGMFDRRRDEGTIYGKVLKNNGKYPILALEVVDHIKKTSVKGLLGPNYFYAEDEWDLKQYLNLKVLCEVSEEDITIFDAAYPNFGLKRYWESDGENILHPLFSANYDRILELLVKSQCTDLAEGYCSPITAESIGINWEGKNLKEIFGLPVGILRKISRLCLLHDNALERIQKIYKRVPNLMTNIEDFSFMHFQFLEGNLFGAAILGRMRLQGFENMSESLQTKIVKYVFEECEPHAFRTYLDYINMCHYIDPRKPIRGYTPKDLQAAHDEAQTLLGDKDWTTKIQETRFQEAIKAESYAIKTFACEDDEFEIQCPKSIVDLRREGNILHHCVGSYVQNIISGVSQIYYLREKEKPDAPYATIEVCDGAVKQLKGPFNGRVEKKGQDYVRKWAKLKGLEIDTYDMREEVRVNGMFE